MSHIVEKKAEKYKKLFIVTFHPNRRKNNILEMLRFFFRSVYIEIIKIKQATWRLRRTLNAKKKKGTIIHVARSMPIAIRGRGDIQKQPQSDNIYTTQNLFSIKTLKS